MKKIFVLFILIFNIYALTLDDIKKNINVENVSAKFTQEKHIKGFSVIKSSGEIKIKDKTLIYILKEPFYHETMINKDGIFDKKDDKWVKNNKEFDKEIFFELLSLDIEKLKNKFDYEIIDDVNVSHILLKPNNILLKKIFTSIKISVDKKIKSIEILEKNGDISIAKYE